MFLCFTLEALEPNRLYSSVNRIDLHVFSFFCVITLSNRHKMQINLHIWKKNSTFAAERQQSRWHIHTIILHALGYTRHFFQGKWHKKCCAVNIHRLIKYVTFWGIISKEHTMNTYLIYITLWCVITVASTCSKMKW